MRAMVGRHRGEVVLTIEGEVGERSIKMRGKRGGRVRIDLRIDPWESKKLAIGMLDEANYCEEEEMS